MTLPEIPADVAAKVKRLFRSDKRKAIAMELIYFDYWPTSEDKQRIADGHEMHVTSIDKILYKLRDSNLFTKEEGSIPLYRAKLVREGAVEPRLERVEVPESGFIKENVERFGDSEEEELESELQENRIKKIEATVHNQGEKIDNFMAEIRASLNRLSVNPSVNNPNPHESPVNLQDTPSIAIPETVEDRLERIEKMIQDEGNIDPFDDLSREQIIELIRSQPQEFMSMVNPDRGGMAGRVEGQPVTLRPMILMLTTYSQMLYERAVYDGYFKGTLSDFANFTMEQYFTDRGWGLDWNKREPANLRRFS